ncbi:DUF3224 domain-containing protein [soil metagenome]
MHAHATGSFDVEIVPQPATDAVLGRMTLAKTLTGDLTGTSRGQMLTAMTAVKGSAGYVAVEQVDAVLHGRSGSFALMHSGTMNRGVPKLSITVVPDSGTGALAGIAGDFRIEIAGGKHLYQFDYSLPDANAAPTP